MKLSELKFPSTPQWGEVAAPGYYGYVRAKQRELFYRDVLEQLDPRRRGERRTNSADRLRNQIYSIIREGSK